MPGSDGNPDPAETLQTFFADGNFVETTSLLGQGGEGPDHGIWMGSGDTYYWAAQLFLFDKATGAHTGRLRVRGDRQTGRCQSLYGARRGRHHRPGRQ